MQRYPWKVYTAEDYVPEPPTLAEMAPGLVASLEYLIAEYGYAGVQLSLIHI